MILFLDTVTSLPEFSLIEDNKIIYVQKIVKNYNEKMSDCIFPAYSNLIDKCLIGNKLDYLVVNTGPGSYTSLRIGISFLLGLSIAKKIQIIGISSVDLFLNVIEKKQFITTGIIINSSNNQNFLCLYNLQKEDYDIKKIESDYNFDNLSKFSLKTILSNSDYFFDSLKLSKNIKYKKFSFKELVVKNIQKIISSSNNDIIRPIYISNNKILN